MKRRPKSAAKLVVLENKDPINAEIDGIQTRIRQRAFEISQTRPPAAHEIYDWIVAESEIISVPPTELIERNGGFELKFAVAGVSASEEVNVMVTADQILVKTEYTHGHDPSDGIVHLCDFNSATVFRVVSLPHPIDVKSVKVELADGMILVSAAKQSAASQPPKRTSRRAPSKKTR